MKIVMVNAYAHLTGGADHHCLSLANELRQRGHEVSFLSTASSRNVEHQGSFIELVVTHHSRDGLPLPERGRVAAKALWNREAANAMKSLVRDVQPDVVHAHRLYPQISVAPLVVARKLRIPIVQTMNDYELIAASALDHDGGWLDRDETRLQYRLLNDVSFLIKRSVHRRAITAWIAPSRCVAEAAERCGIRANVLPYFTEPSEVARRPLEARSGVVFAGRLKPEKGVADVIRVAQLLPELRVTLAGDGPLRDVVEQASMRLPNVTYLGAIPHDQVIDLLGSARVLLMPSRWEEPGGLSALEAMAVGTPVVAFKLGGLAEYIGDAGAGFTVDANPHALADACRRLYTDDELWRRCGERGTAAVAGTHSPEQFIHGLVRVYHEAVAH